MPRIRLAVLFGGRSTEHSISCISAGSVLRAVDRERYDVVPVGITRDGRWVLAPDDPSALEPRGRELPEVDGTGTAVTLAGDPTVKGLLVLEPADVPRALTTVDVAFPLLHGPYGEDGTIQGLLELAGVPYVGSGVLASAVAMDKEYMKLVLAARGLPVGASVVVPPGRAVADVTDDVAALGYPVFVKPARGGSSIGVSRVSDAAELPAALELAREGDPKVLVEAAVPGREIECAVLGGRGGGPPEASLPAEITVPGGWYDFDAKYLGDAARFDVPAELPPELTEEVRRTACAAFTALGCAGLARVDFFLRPDGALVVNEVNTMPGFTPMSMYPRMWEATGVSYAELVDRLVARALDAGTGLR